MAVRFPPAVPFLKVVEGARVVLTVMVVDPTAEGEVVEPGLTRIVVVVDAGEVVEAEAVEEGPDIILISKSHMNIQKRA